METILSLRRQINHLDRALIQLLAKRNRISNKIGVIKKRQGLAIHDRNRWQILMTRNIQIAKHYKLNSDLVKKIYKLIHEDSIRIQNKQT